MTVRHLLLDADDVVQLSVGPTITPDRGVLDLIGRWRASGLTVHLATNQDSGRAALMKARLGYDAVLDGSYYSIDLGVAKPAAGFFEAVLADLRAEPAEVCFVDDLAVNVEGARQVGLRAVQWELDHGLPALAERLAEHGIRTDLRG